MLPSMRVLNPATSYENSLFFPVYQENQAETGSLWTASTTTDTAIFSRAGG